MFDVLPLLAHQVLKKLFAKLIRALATMQEG